LQVVVFRKECFEHYMMDRRQFILSERLQAAGMPQAGFTNRRVTGQMGIHHFIIETTPRENMQITQCGLCFCKDC